MAANWVFSGASVALVVVIGCHFGLFADLAASPPLLELAPPGGFLLLALLTLLLLAAGLVALAAGKLHPNPVNMSTLGPPSPISDGSHSPGGRLRRRSSVAPTTLETIVEKLSADKSTASSHDTQPNGLASAGPSPADLQSSPPRASPSPPATGSTLRVTEISVEASIEDDSGTTAADPVPKLINVPLNCIQEPYAFENEFVRGKLVFMVDSADNSVPEPADVRTRFEGRRRLFWVQVQLQFKLAPSGIVYIGGEVPRPMSLGFFTGGMTKVILSVLQSLVPGLHYSFGHSDGNSDGRNDSSSSEADSEELPHICFPLYSAVDQFVATPPGETPPTLGSEDFGETKEQSQQRRRSGLLMYPFNTRDTYSFHFHSFFIDFAHWQLVNLPGLRSTDLRAFWDNMPLRIVCYSLNDTSRTRSDTLHKATSGRSIARRASYTGGSSAVASNAKKAVHSWATKEYKFCLELRPQDPNAIPLSSVKAAVVSDSATTAFGTPRDTPLVQDTELILKRLHEVHRELSCYELRVPSWFEYFSHTRTHSERRVGYVIAVRTISIPPSADEDEDHDNEQEVTEAANLGQPKPEERPRVTGEYVLLHSALVAFTPLSFVEQALPERGVRGREESKNSSDESLGSLDSTSKAGRSGSGNSSTFSARQLFGNRSRSVEDSITVRARSLRYAKIDDERQFLEQQLQLLAATAPGSPASVLPEQLCAAKLSLLDLLQSRQSPSALEIEWPFLTAHCAISSSDVFTRSDKDDVSMPSEIARANGNTNSPFDTTIRPASPLRSGRSCQSVQVLRVISSSQWRNEWMTLHPAGHTLRFFRTQSSSCKLAIAVDQVLGVNMGSPAFSSCWCRSHYRDAGATVVESIGGTALYWLHIGLVEKCHHIAFASPEEQEKWFELLSGNAEMSSPGSPKMLPSVVPIVTRSQPVIDLLLNQSIIRSTSRLSLDSFAVDVCVGGGNVIGSGKPRLTKRFVLNERCLVRLRGVCACTLPESSRGQFDAAPDSGDLVRRCLRQAIKLQAIRLDNFSTAELIRFHDSVCALHWVDLTTLFRGINNIPDATGGNISGDYDNEGERKAFFLNLFHLMMIHSSILGLLPKSRTKWAKFFNGVTYNVGGMYFSLAEIEHGILRAPMSPLRLPIAFLVIPRLGEPEVDPRALFRLEQSDFRLNFAMNCMTRSCWVSIAVFDRSHINEQLDRAVSESIARSLLYDRANHVVQLPKVCDWYRDDFSTTSSQAAATVAAESIPRALTTNHAILGLLLRFVRGPQRPLLEYAWQHPLGLVDKYTFEKYDYRFQDALIETPPLVEPPSAGDVDP
jgi:hypothetical protein